ncbi:MAG: flagellar basal body rod protein FlgB [candidate division Zixibacteria bacterium]
MADFIKATIWQKTGVDKLSKFLDLASQRHKLITANLANTTTPGYAAKDIDFKAEMKKALGSGPVLAMKATNPGHIPNSGPNNKVKILKHGPESDDDLNGVDIDREVTNLAVNQMRYSIGSRILQRKVQFLKKAIRGS